MKNRKEGSGNGVVLRRMLRGSVRYFVICILSGVTFTALELIIPQILRLTVDSVIGDKPVRLPDALKSMWEELGGAEYFRAHMGVLAAVLIGVGLLSAAFRYAMNLYSSIACETMVKTSRDLLYHQIERLPWSWHMKNATGDIIQRCTADVERIKLHLSCSQSSFYIRFCSTTKSVSALQTATRPRAFCRPSRRRT